MSGHLEVYTRYAALRVTGTFINLTGLKGVLNLEFLSVTCYFAVIVFNMTQKTRKRIGEQQ